MIAKGGYIYIVSNKNRTVLYIGVTSDLYQRIWQHKNGMGSVFTKKYNCTDILYYEFFQDIESAIRREKLLKKYNRKWKEDLIKSKNPQCEDIFDEIVDMR